MSAADFKEEYFREVVSGQAIKVISFKSWCAPSAFTLISKEEFEEAYQEHLDVYADMIRAGLA